MLQQINMKKEVKEAIKTAKLAYNYAKDVFKGLDHEELWVLFLDNRCNPIALEKMTMGGWTSTVIDFRQIFATCLQHKATGMILYHNHLSGSSLPSLNDIQRTRDLQQICKIFEIRLIDHIIISDREYYSFTDELTTEIRNGKRK